MNSRVYTLICFALWFADSRFENEKKSRSGESTIAATILFKGKLTPLFESRSYWYDAEEQSIPLRN